MKTNRFMMPGGGNRGISFIQVLISTSIALFFTVTLSKHFSQLYKIEGERKQRSSVYEDVMNRVSCHDTFKDHSARTLIAPDKMTDLSGKVLDNMPGTAYSKIRAFAGPKNEVLHEDAINYKLLIPASVEFKVHHNSRKLVQPLNIIAYVDKSTFKIKDCDFSAKRAIRSESCQNIGGRMGTGENCHMASEYWSVKNGFDSTGYATNGAMIDSIIDNQTIGFVNNYKLVEKDLQMEAIKSSMEATVKGLEAINQTIRSSTVKADIRSQIFALRQQLKIMNSFKTTNTALDSIGYNQFIITKEKISMARLGHMQLMALDNQPSPITGIGANLISVQKQRNIANTTFKFNTNLNQN